MSRCKEYDFRQIETKWQSFWEQNRTFRANEVANDGAADAAKPKYYVLDMFPYPSGAGLHLGHCENYAITDILARFKRAQGFNVLYPIGWDAFGLPTENYAVKTGRHPADVTRENVATFKRQLRSIGVSYDFDREINTTDPHYFKWTQWIWLKLFERGLAYVEDKPVWWCPALGTVLANEEVIDGKSEVGSHPVERRPLRQWVLRITAYADRLLAGLKDLDWPDSTKRMQAAWIGRSEGTEVEFDIEGVAPDEARLKIFTTRVDTLYGATYMVIAPEHPLAARLTTPEQRDAVAAYTRAAASKSDLERAELSKEKTGVFTGSYAINPANGKHVPIWVADYVLASYGTGAIMAVPAHDERDYAFAKKFGLPVVQVIARKNAIEATAADGDADALPFCESGDGLHLINSDDCNGLTPAEATAALQNRFAAEGRGKATAQYKLRDWLFSRQRYWGEPFPIVWVSKTDYAAALATAKTANLPLPPEPVTATFDGEERYALPLPASALPLELPKVQGYEPTGTGESPLAAVTEWLEIWHEPQTGKSVPASEPRPAPHWVRARRETNTMPQWAGSCWYYLRYLDPQNADALASPEALRYWSTPDLYVGGAEHAVLHLLYARFWHKVLYDLGLFPTDEPFTRLFHQGLILGEDGEKMSKSRGNVANPDDIIAHYGADTLRLYLMFLGPLEAMKPWSPRGIEGVYRFLQKIWRECLDGEGRPSAKLNDSQPDNEAFLRVLHETIRKVGDDIAALRYNTAISQMMICANALQKAPHVRRASIKLFLQVLAPFAPHFCEELWERLGESSGSLATAPWPAYDPQWLERDECKLVFQVNGKHRGDALVPKSIGQEDAVALAKAHPKVASQLEGKTIRRIIFVPQKIINLVVA
ncbi:leucine--tRNA ligase [Cephaloticoccus capnophilus]|uniref:Leucine--tRNA ligase n=1 Tax=Cephaloticoccus capnophilus TaxID=1548208 RepID=A0A139STR4_9BACT|nr:leucine--tRNA ligase [Cephaloticoccus capnophilus]KXU37966.1 leucine--tRNA ligase [Cephaloticoccus capnophilus]